VKSVILLGDVRKRLSEIPSGSVRTCITSPPYFGLRDYGTGDWEGGDPTCSHKRDSKHSDFTITGHKNPLLTVGDAIYKSVCPRCGAVRIDNQIGLEETPDAYVTEMVAVFREVWRVLADDGTLWLNIGDSYAAAKSGGGTMAGFNDRYFGTTTDGGKQAITDKSKPSRPKVEGLKSKDLIGIPWRVAFALQADGWYLRSDIIWHKPNPMPESVTDRPTKSHEYLFLLTKSAKYYYDHEAIKEPAIHSSDRRAGGGRLTYEGKRQGDDGTCQEAFVGIKDKRNKRDVWTINTKPFKGAHFAVMPEALVEPCILAGSEEGDTVLDPFTGSGTVAVVANRLGRNFVGTELNPEYAEIAKERIINSAPMFNQVEIV